MIKRSTFSFLFILFFAIPQYASAVTVRGTISGCGHNLPGITVVAYKEAEIIGTIQVIEVGRIKTNVNGDYSISYQSPTPFWDTVTNVFVEVLGYSGSSHVTSPKYSIETDSHTFSPDICNPSESGPFPVRSKIVDINISDQVNFPSDDEYNDPIDCADENVLNQKPPSNTNKAIVYYPRSVFNDNEIANGSFPLIVLGHAHREYGCGTPENNRNDYKYYYNIAERLVSWGFIVISVDLHWLSRLYRRDEYNYDNRIQLLSDALDYMIKEHCRLGSLFFNKVDVTKIGAIGHSMGAITAHLLAAEEGRVDALALLGPARPTAVLSSLPKSNPLYISPRPVMTLMGSLDWAAGSPPNILGTDLQIFNFLGTSKYRVIIEGGNHWSYTDGIGGSDLDSQTEAPFQLSIAQTYITGFFQRHLKCSNTAAVNAILSGSQLIRLASIIDDPSSSSGCYSLNPTPAQRIIPPCFETINGSSVPESKIQHYR